MYDYATALADGKPAAGAVSIRLRQELQHFLAPVLQDLERHLDARLVRTFFRLLEVILCFRHRALGLLLSELGAYLLEPAQAPAGTKRISNLLRSPRWDHTLLDQALWRRAGARQQELAAAGEEVLALWDESVLEKPESLHPEGLGFVRSAKAARLKRIKPGFYTPPGGPPVFVPGNPWLCLLLLGLSGPPTLAVMRWWTNRASGHLTPVDPRTVREALLQQCARTWGRRVLHIWDRGYAGSPWLGLALRHRLRFVLRWPKRWTLRQADGRERPAWQVVRGQRSWEKRRLRDARRGGERLVGVYAVSLYHPDFRTPLWLVVARSGAGQEPWYLLTTEPVETAADAWRIVLAYARRWQIEMAFRYGKSELALESPRLWRWEHRLKLLLIVTLAYAFLLSLLDERFELLRTWLLRHFCHRTGQRGRNTPTPLYRLRSAISRLWLAHPAAPPGCAQTPG
jgi:hypothetical protein